MPKKRIFGFFLVVPLIAGSMFLVSVRVALADTIQLRNGRVIYGKIVGQTRTTIRVKANGRVMVLRKKSIAKASYGVSAAERRAASGAKRRREALKRKRIAAKRAAEEKRRAESARKKAAEKRAAEEKRRAESARKKAAEKRAAEEKRRAELARKAAAEKRRSVKPVNSGTDWSYVWKSALLPGWGHWSHGDKITGWIYTGSFLAALGLTAATRSTAASAETTYNTDVTTNFFLTSAAGGLSGTTGQLLYLNTFSSADSTYSNSQSASSRANGILTITGLLYIGQLVHAWLASGTLDKASAVGPVPAPIARVYFFSRSEHRTPRSAVGTGGRRMGVRYEFSF